MKSETPAHDAEKAGDGLLSIKVRHESWSHKKKSRRHSRREPDPAEQGNAGLWYRNTLSAVI